MIAHEKKRWTGEGFYSAFLHQFKKVHEQSSSGLEYAGGLSNFSLTNLFYRKNVRAANSPQEEQKISQKASSNNKNATFKRGILIKPRKARDNSK